MNRKYPRNFRGKQKAYVDAYISTWKEFSGISWEILKGEVELCDAREARDRRNGDASLLSKRETATTEGTHQALRDACSVARLRKTCPTPEQLQVRIVRMRQSGDPTQVELAEWLLKEYESAEGELK